MEKTTFLTIRSDGNVFLVAENEKNDKHYVIGFTEQVDSLKFSYSSVLQEVADFLNGLKITFPLVLDFDNVPLRVVSTGLSPFFLFQDALDYFIKILVHEASLFANHDKYYEFIAADQTKNPSWTRQTVTDDHKAVFILAGIDPQLPALYFGCLLEPDSAVFNCFNVRNVQLYCFFILNVMYEFYNPNTRSNPRELRLEEINSYQNSSYAPIASYSVKFDVRSLPAPEYLNDYIVERLLTLEWSPAYKAFNFLNKWYQLPDWACDNLFELHSEDLNEWVDEWEKLVEEKEHPYELSNIHSLSIISFIKENYELFDWSDLSTIEAFNPRLSTWWSCYAYTFEVILMECINRIREPKEIIRLLTGLQSIDARLGPDDFDKLFADYDSWSGYPAEWVIELLKVES